MSKTPNSIKRLLGTAMVLLACPAVSMAITQNHETLPLLTSPVENKTGAYTFQNISSFNDALGTLIAVDFTLTLYSKSYVTVFNTNMVPEQYFQAKSKTSGSASLTYETTAGPGILSVVSGTDKSGPFSGTVGAGDTTAPKFGSQSVSGPDSFTVDDPGTYYSGNSTSTYDLVTNFKENAGMFSGMVKSGDPGVYFGGGDDLYETLSIEYFYCDCMSVPEPSTIPLVVLSLGALFLGRRFLVKRARLA